MHYALPVHTIFVSYAFLYLYIEPLHQGYGLQSEKIFYCFIPSRVLRHLSINYNGVYNQSVCVYSADSQASTIMNVDFKHLLCSYNHLKTRCVEPFWKEERCFWSNIYTCVKIFAFIAIYSVVAEHEYIAALSCIKFFSVVCICTQDN